MSVGSQGRNTTIAFLSLICAVFFTLTIIFAHVTTDTLNFLSATLSRYALEEYGYILESGFISIGLTQLLLAFLLFNYINVKQLKPVSLFLFFAGIGVIVVAIFPTLPAPASIADRLPHIIGAVLQFFCFPVAVLKLSTKMARGTFKTYTWYTGIVTTVLFIAMLFLFVLPSMKDFAYFGLIEKTNILAINFWLIFMSFIFYKLTHVELLQSNIE